MSGSIFTTGWNRGIRVQANYLLLVAALLGSGTAMAEEVDVPPLELLEYLGEWQDADGRWLDPETLQLAMQAGGEQANEEDKDE